MWQHGASQLMFALALYFLVRGFEEPKKTVWAGLFLSLPTLSRPTGAVVVVIVSFYLLLKVFFDGKGGRFLVKQFKSLYFFEYLFLGLLPLAVFLAIPEMSRGVLASYGSQVGSS